ncbi:MAG: hypothetical protein J0H14_05670 [Alphaproteobacteria bacterium]|nr:hypothetical protein [Alphaproteobacteria bacterium]
MSGAAAPTGCRAPDLAAGPKQREMCQGCGGAFDAGTMLLAELAPGRPDKLGNRVAEIYCRGEDFCVYRSTLGVYVHFADCRAREREQRRALLPIAPRLCRLRYMSNQMARDRLWRQGGGGFYDHEIGEAIALALQGTAGEADRLLANGEALAVERLRNENRVAYFLSCLASALLVIGVLFAAGLGTATGDAQFQAYAAAAAFGAVGAAFSIATGVADLSLAPYQRSAMNSAMGALRVLIGAVSGAMILLICNATIIGEPVLKLLEKFTEADALGTLGTRNWAWIGMLGLLGGFAERLVPNLLGSAAGRATPRSAQPSP